MVMITPATAVTVEIGKAPEPGFWLLAKIFRFWGQSGHRLVRCICPLLTQSGYSVSRDGRQGELKYGAARFIRLCPQPAPMGIDDRPANR